MTPYTTTDIFDYIEAINCSEDVRQLETMLSFCTQDEREFFKQTLGILKELFI